MVFVQVLTVALVGWSSGTAFGQEECSLGECGGEESSLLALHAAKVNVSEESETRRRRPPTQCVNRHGDQFVCAGGDHCCGDVCVAQGDSCCENTNGNTFPCGGPNSCCGNACKAPESKCCRNAQGYYYPVTQATKCAGKHWWPDFQRQGVHCINTHGDEFLCAAGNSCCGDVCVVPGGACCRNDAENSFPCGSGSSCCGNACAAPGSKCCRNSGRKALFYPVSQGTECSDE